MDTIEKTSVYLDSPVQLRIPSLESGLGKLRSAEQMKAICVNLYRKGFINSSFSDITIAVLGMEYRLHRLILAQNSYFAAMLEREWKESAQPRIELALDDPHISVESMTRLFARMYGETQTRINEKNAVAALACGVYFNDLALADISLDFIISNLDSTNVLDYLDCADSFDYGLHSSSIQDACLSFICSRDPDNLVSILSHASLELIEKIVSSDALCVRCEFERYRLITQILDGLTDCSNDTHENDQAVPDLDRGRNERIDYHERSKEILEKSVIYANLSFEELKIVQMEDRVSSHILMSALWNQRQQEHDTQIISSETKEACSEALLKSPSHQRFIPPMSDTDRMNKTDISEHILRSPVHQHKALETSAPLRFQVEFKNLNQVCDRVYSELFWHAGSHWHVYLQMPLQRTEDKIGLYLQRIVTGGSILPSNGSSNNNTSERYTDPRPAVRAWFRMFLFMSQTNCYVLESRPDTFKDNQSWGWQCQTLYRELLGREGRQSLKVSVILGVLDAPN